MNNSSLKKGASHPSDGGETTQGFQTSSRNNSHMQPAILVNTDTNNSIAPAVVSSSEVNIELIDKLFRSFK